jgi:hypothetical protein
VTVEAFDGERGGERRGADAFEEHEGDDQFDERIAAAGTELQKRLQ